VNAVATVIVAVVSLGVAGVGSYLTRRQKRRQREPVEGFGKADQDVRWPGDVAKFRNSIPDDRTRQG